MGKTFPFIFRIFIAFEFYIFHSYNIQYIQLVAWHENAFFTMRPYFVIVCKSSAAPSVPNVINANYVQPMHKIKLLYEPHGSGFGRHQKRWSFCLLERRLSWKQISSGKINANNYLWLKKKIENEHGSKWIRDSHCTKRHSCKNSATITIQSIYRWKQATQVLRETEEKKISLRLGLGEENEIRWWVQRKTEENSLKHANLFKWIVFIFSFILSFSFRSNVKSPLICIFMHCRHVFISFHMLSTLYFAMLC